MKRIIVKNSDKLSSLVHPQKVVDEYLVYLLDDEVPISAEAVYGVSDKNKLVDKLLTENFGIDNNDYLEELVEEMTFSEFLTQFDDE